MFLVSTNTLVCSKLVIKNIFQGPYGSLIEMFHCKQGRMILKNEVNQNLSDLVGACMGMYI